MPEEQEEFKLSTEEKGWLGKIKDSISENWQTILVALIVLIVGISAYNYNSKTGSNPSDTNVEQSAEADQTAAEQKTDDTGKTDQEAAAENKDQEAAKAQDQATDDTKTASQTSDAAKETNKETTVTAAQNTNTVTSAGESYKVVAVRGEGLTHLARKALNKYLEENKDDQLTALHRIYIEDYMRKHIPGAGKQGMKIGTEEAFSKSMIADAIASSKKLSQKSLDNLKRYQVAK